MSNHPKYDLAKDRARGVWYASPHIWDDRKWAVISPGGTIVDLCGSKKEAVARLETLARIDDDRGASVCNDAHRREATMIDADIIGTIGNFDPQRIDGMLHFPEIHFDYFDKGTRSSCIHCACGVVFDCDERHAPSDQPWPRHWVGFQEFLKHVRGLEWSAT